MSILFSCKKKNIGNIVCAVFAWGVLKVEKYCVILVTFHILIFLLIYLFFFIFFFHIICASSRTEIIYNVFPKMPFKLQQTTF